jgi:hypothetical protein
MRSLGQRAELGQNEAVRHCHFVAYQAAGLDVLSPRRRESITRLNGPCRVLDLPMPRPTSVMSRSRRFEMLALPLYQLCDTGIGKPGSREV